MLATTTSNVPTMSVTGVSSTSISAATSLSDALASRRRDGVGRDVDRPHRPCPRQGRHDRQHPVPHPTSSTEAAPERSSARRDQFSAECPGTELRRRMIPETECAGRFDHDSCDRVVDLELQPLGDDHQIVGDPVRSGVLAPGLCRHRRERPRTATTNSGRACGRHARSKRRPGPRRSTARPLPHPRPFLDRPNTELPQTIARDVDVIDRNGDHEGADRRHLVGGNPAGAQSSRRSPVRYSSIRCT